MCVIEIYFAQYYPYTVLCTYSINMSAAIIQSCNPLNIGVEIKTIASFNRMKQLCDDISLVVKAMKLCSSVEVCILINWLTLV